MLPYITYLLLNLGAGHNQKDINMHINNLHIHSYTKYFLCI